MGIKKTSVNIFALAALGKGLSGSDRIFIEFARRWSKKYRINIYLWTEGRKMCQSQNLNDEKIAYRVSSMRPWKDLGFFANYIARIFEGIKLGLTLKIKNNENIILYSASDFWMDSLPCFILKLRFSSVKWVATWYQTAPDPFVGFAEGEREKKYRLSALLYWFSQLPIKPLISGFADFILVNNEDERRQFARQNKLGRVKVVLGAVDVQKINTWVSKNSKTPKIYDAVFQGRFHPQKGPVELIEIWRAVVNKKPDARLAMIGDGPLMEEVKLKIKNLGLENNIKLLGYVFDGDRKYRTFSQSKIVVHPAFYDSGGMASAEAMAFGLPCVGFNLKSYISYYPKGMVKVKIGDQNAFAKEILKLLLNSEYRKRVGGEAFEMINNYWSWDMRAREVLENVTK